MLLWLQFSLSLCVSLALSLGLGLGLSRARSFSRALSLVPEPYLSFLFIYAPPYRSLCFPPSFNPLFLLCLHVTISILLDDEEKNDFSDRANPYCM